MKEAFKAQKISENLYWVGAIDWTLREFHGYATPRGTTYNAYLAVGEKTVLFDAVKAPFKEELLARIASVINPAKIDVIVSNHSEMDHSGCLPEVIDFVRPEKVYASPNGVKTLTAHFHGDPNALTAVEDGQKIDIGPWKLTFLESKMLHWPDSMFTYFHNDDVLISQDGFGMHLAGYERFADEVDQALLEHEGGKYYANILLPYSNLILKALERIGSLKLPIKMIAPDHGPIWRTPEQIGRILELYKAWAEQKPTDRAVIVYDTMWHSTDLMARAIGEGLTAGGARAVLHPLGEAHRSDIATEMLDAGALIVGSPTMNNNIFPTLADVLTYLKGLRPKNLIGAAFGSYGWGGEAPKQLAAILDEMKIEQVAEPLRISYVPDEESLKQAYDLGQTIAKKMKAFAG